MSADEEFLTAVGIHLLERYDLTNVQVVAPFEPLAASAGTTEPLWVHTETTCKGRDREIIGCCIHAPSDHPLNQAPLAWIPQYRCMIRVCEHGEGHTDPDDLAYRIWCAVMGDSGTHSTLTVWDTKERTVEAYSYTHECTCKCCVPPEIGAPV